MALNLASMVDEILFLTFALEFHGIVGGLLPARLVLLFGYGRRIGFGHGEEKAVHSFAE